MLQVAGNPFGDSQEFKQIAPSCEIKTNFIILCNQFTHLLKNVLKLEHGWICAFFVQPTMQGVYAKTELCLLDVISCSRIIRALSAVPFAFCVRKYLRHTQLLCLFSLTLFIWQLKFKGCEVPIYMFVTPLSQVTVVGSRSAHFLIISKISKYS